MGGQSPPTPPTRAMGATSSISGDYLVLDSSFQLHSLPREFPTAEPQFSSTPLPPHTTLRRENLAVDPK